MYEKVLPDANLMDGYHIIIQYKDKVKSLGIKRG